MAGKRPHGDGGEESSAHTDKRLRFLKTACGDLENSQSVEEFLQKLLTLIQNVAREEIPTLAHPSIISSPSVPSQNPIESSGSRTLQLHIDCELLATIFTGNSILSKDGKSVKIVLLDSGSKNITTSGSLSSLKANVVVLDGDFSPDDQNNWTEREFECKIVQNREGKRPLVIGELTVELKEGVGYIGEASFTDNSSWIKSRKFRLGVKVDAKYNIREGVSKAFRVKDCRGELYQKHYPPSLEDEVWRLEKIGKGGASQKRLTDKGISSVRGLLEKYHTDPSLQSSLKIKDKAWKAVIKHAKTCKDYDKLYPSIGADNVNHPSSSMPNANIPVQRDMQMNLAHPTTSLAVPLHNYEVEQERSPIQGFNTLASGANYACPSIEDPNAASADQVDEFFSGFNHPIDGTFCSNLVFRFP